MRRLLALGIGAAAGFGLLWFVVGKADWAEVGATFRVLGWGIALVVLYRFFNLALDAAGWWRVLSSLGRVSFFRIFSARWVGESVNTLLPVLQVGGDIVRARMATRMGFAWNDAGASIVIDFTAGLASQFLFTILGVVALAAMRPADDSALAWALLLVAAGAVLTVFYLIQRYGFFSLVARFAKGLLGTGTWARSLDESVDSLYRDRRAVFVCIFWRLSSWMAHVGEVWLVVAFMERPIGLLACLAIESLSYAARSAAFAIPGAVGVQEGGVVAIGLLVGLDMETALALALVKRVREVALGLPGLAIWAVSERESLIGILGRGRR